VVAVVSTAEVAVVAVVAAGSGAIRLDVACENAAARRFYLAAGFSAISVAADAAAQLGYVRCGCS
jgi:ribosomal protein S18 acetylase RimI-like enzyme